MTTTKKAADLLEGDVILHPQHALPGLIICRSGCYFPMQVKVTVLHDAKHTTETVAPLAGRPCITVWGQREDTGQRGTLTYGPNAEVDLAVTS